MAELLRLLAVDDSGSPVWETWEELADEVDAGEIDEWARASGADRHFSEPDLDEADRRRNANLMEMRGVGGFDLNEAVDAKAYGRLSPYDRMVTQLALGFHLDPYWLRKLDYPMLRGMLAKANMDAKAAEHTAPPGSNAVR